MRAELKKLQTELGISFIHVTHSQEEALAIADLIVVMNDGRIEQTGTPHEVYRTPRTHFVARFIGGHNVLSGRVAMVDGAYCQLHAEPLGPFLVPASNGVQGEEVFFAVRGDAIAIDKAGVGVRADEPNAIAGRVATVQYQGHWVQVGIAVDGADEIDIVVSERQFFDQPVAVGDPVIARWRHDNVHVLEPVGSHLR